MKKNGRALLIFAVLSCFMDGLTMTGRAEEASPPIELGPVVVTATRQEAEAFSIPSHITVITREEIDRSGASNAGDLLRSEAGLWVVNTSGSTPTGIMIDGRGFNNGAGNGSRVLVLVDGRRTNLPDTSNPDWATIPVESIERIEIVRGPATALYGDNAVAGVINVITKQGRAEPLRRLTSEAGSYGFQKRKAMLSGAEKALTYYLYGGYESSDGYRENSDYRASHYVGNFAYRVGPSSNLRFRTGYLSNERLLPGSLTESEIAALGRHGSVANEDHGGVHQAQFDVGFDSHLSQRDWIELAGGQTFRASGSRITVPDAGYTEINDDTRSIAAAGKYQIRGRKIRLMMGLDLLNETVRSESFNNFPDPFFPFVVMDQTNYERRLIGAYVTGEYSPHSALILSLSGRTDRSDFEFSRTERDLTFGTTTRSSGDRSFHVFSPKVGLTFLTTPSSRLFANWSRSFRFPNRDELTGFFGFTPELDPERATTYEVGGKVQSGNRLESTVSVFQTRVKDEILFVPPAVGEFAFGQNENVPEIRHQGVEASAALRQGEMIRMKVNYAMVRTRIVKGPFEGGSLPITPRHSGSATIEFGREMDWVLSVTGRYVGKRILANDLANEQPNLPAYAVYDTRLGEQGQYFEWFFSINNVFNRKYEDFGGVGGFPFGSRIGFNPSPERNYTGGITLRF